MVELHRQHAGWSLLDDSQFRDAWQQLAVHCPWATVFQSPEFIVTWFETYRTQYDPVLLVGTDEVGNLRGLLPLGLSRDGKSLVFAGAHQAEYQVWIGTEADNGAFFVDALRELALEYPRHRLRFRFVPENAPLGPLYASRDVQARVQIATHFCPLAKCGTAAVAQSFRKSGNKSRINRLKRIADLEFVRLPDCAALEPHIDEFIAAYDLRQDVAHGVRPFLADPLKRELLRRLMSKHPNIVHATILRLGSSVIAGHFGMISWNTRRLHVGMIAHSPLYAAQSPGKLNILFLLRQLGDEGFLELDLTPGGDAWKERFATHHNQVRELTVYPSAAAMLRANLKRNIVELARLVVIGFGPRPAGLRRIIRVTGQIPRYLGQLWRRPFLKRDL